MGLLKRKKKYDRVTAIVQANISINTFIFCIPVTFLDFPFSPAFDMLPAVIAPEGGFIILEILKLKWCVQRVNYKS